MRLSHLNPQLRSVVCLEKPLRTDVLCAYDARMLYVLSGGLTVQLGDDKAKKLSPGAFLYIPAGQPFRLRASYVRLLVASFDLTDAYDAPPPPPAMADVFDATLAHTVEDTAPFHQPIVLDEAPELREDALTLLGMYRTDNPYAEARASAHLKGMLVRMAEGCDENALPSHLIEALDAYIREHADEEISNTELGATFGYHPFYISQLLKKRRGITLHQYILSYKLSCAADRLRYTMATVAEIASGLSFSDASYFTKSFKSAYGMTPKDYRKSFDDAFI